MRGMRAPLIAINWSLMRLYYLCWAFKTTCCLWRDCESDRAFDSWRCFTTYTKTAIFLVVEQEIQPFFLVLYSFRIVL